MVLPVQQFHIPTPEQMGHPNFNVYLAQALKNAQSAQQVPYAGRTAEAEMNEKIAHALLQKQEAEKISFLMKHPQYINPLGFLMQQAQQHQQGMGQTRGQPSYGQPQGYNQPSFGMPSQPQMMGGNQNVSTGQQMGAAPSQQMGAAPSQQMGATPSEPGVESQEGQATQQNTIDPNAFSYTAPNIGSPTGNPMMDAAYYKNFGMNPSDEARVKLAEQNALMDQKNLQQKVNVSGNQLNDNTDTIINADKILSAIDKMNALETGPLAGHNKYLVSQARQEMNQAAANVVASGSRLLQGGGHVTDSDIALVNMMKTNDFNDKDVNFDIAQGIKAKAERLLDEQKFYSAAYQLGLKKSIADSLWSDFQRQRPYFDPITKMPNGSYEGTFTDYLTAPAINAAVHGQKYTPPNQKVLMGMNFTREDLKQLKDKHYSKYDLRHTSVKHNISYPQVKMEFIKRDILHYPGNQ